MSTPARALAALLIATGGAPFLVNAQIPTQAAPGQPQFTAKALNAFEIVGDTIASAQQMFLGTLDKLYIVDKTENNPTQINGHPAWAAEYSLSKNTGRAMDIVTNSFCAVSTYRPNPCLILLICLIVATAFSAHLKASIAC